MHWDYRGRTSRQTVTSIVDSGAFLCAWRTLACHRSYAFSQTLAKTYVCFDAVAEEGWRHCDIFQRTHVCVLRARTLPLHCHHRISSPFTRWRLTYASAFRRIRLTATACANHCRRSLLLLDNDIHSNKRKFSLYYIHIRLLCSELLPYLLWF